MADCPGGSRLKPSITENEIWVRATDFFQAAGEWQDWLSPVFNQLFPKLVDLEVMCSSPPRPLPTIDWLGLATSGQLYSVPQILLDWLMAAWENEQWQTYCECNPVSSEGGCFPLDVGYSGPASTNGFSVYKLAGPWNHPYGFTNASVTITYDNPGGPHFASEWRLYDAAHTEIARQSWYFDVPGVHQTDFSSAIYTQEIKNNIRTVELWGNAWGPTEVDRISYKVGSFVGCTPGEVIPPPPDPYPLPPPPDSPLPPPLPVGCTNDQICAQLAVISQALTVVSQYVQMQQRYGLPFAYLPGPLHSGLTGSGFVAIQGLVGVQVDVTANLPPRRLEGTPEYVWDIGWMTIGTADGMIEEKRITRDVEIWQPARIQEATLFGYYLKDSVVMAMRELKPEP